MPLYEFRCQACDEICEILQKISDPNPETCPRCSKGPLKKLMSRAAFQLKGGGWYETDFRAGGPRAKDPESDKKTADDKGGATKETPAAESKNGESKSEAPAKEKSEPAPAKTKDSKPASAANTAKSSSE